MADTDTDLTYLAEVKYIGFDYNPDKTQMHFSPGDQVRVLDYYTVRTSDEGGLPCRKKVSKWREATVLEVKHDRSGWNAC